MDLRNKKVCILPLANLQVAIGSKVINKGENKRTRSCKALSGPQELKLNRVSPFLLPYRPLYK